MKFSYLNLDRALGFALTILLLTCLAFYVLVVFWRQPTRNEPLKIEVPRGASLSQIAELLKTKAVIDNSKTFVLAARLLGYEKSIMSGVFWLRNTRSNYVILNQLVEASPVVRLVTIPEGLRMAEVAAILSEKLGIVESEFLELCRSERFIHSLGLEVPSLEGFLFPETYYFNEGEEPETIIRRIVEQYRQMFNNSVRKRLEELKMSEVEVVTLASIIEGEAIYDSERPLISAVYHNRLQKGMMLQADPTIQYIIEDGPRRLLNKDLMIESPYNTYLNHGLPPGPINSPGKESILAALYPADVDYLYFVANGDGYHTFAQTEQEHLQAKKKFQKVRRKARKEKKLPSQKKDQMRS